MQGEISMLSFERGKSTIESDVLLNLIKEADSVIVVPLKYKGAQVGLRYMFSSDVTLDEWSPSKDKVKKGIKVKYTKKKNGLTSYEERCSKEFYIDASCMQNVFRLMSSDMIVRIME